MLIPSIMLVVGLATFAILQDYRFMTALKSAQPELYEAYGGHTFFPAPPRLRMMSAVLSGRYKSEVTDPLARAFAGQLRAAMLIFFVALLAVVAFQAWIFGRNA